MAVAAFFILLCGCGAKPGNAGIPEKIQQTYDQLSGFTAQVKILSDLGQSTLEYSGEFEYNKEDNDKFTLKTPDALTGIDLIASGRKPREFDGTV